MEVSQGNWIEPLSAHPYSCVLSYLGDLYYNQGELMDAERVQMLRVELCCEVFPVRHFENLAAFSHLIPTLMKLGKIETASKLMDIARKTVENVAGPNHKSLKAPYASKPMHESHALKRCKSKSEPCLGRYKGPC